jgi:curved DNA-binding protein CbpA
VSPYETLGVPPDATPEAITAAYRQKARQHHPDRGGDHGEMSAINDAYAVLSDPARREQFDKTGATRSGPTPEQKAREIAFSAMAAALDQPGDDLDLVRAARSALERSRAEGRAKLSEVKEVRRRTEKRRERLVGGDLFAGLFDQRLENMSRAQAHIEEQLAAIGRALELLEDIQWAGDASGVHFVLFSSSGTSTCS